MGVWKSDVGVRCRVAKSSWRQEGVMRAKAHRTHEHVSTIVADNNIGAPGAKDLSVALTKCPNLHTLVLSSQ